MAFFLIAGLTALLAAKKCVLKLKTKIGIDEKNLFDLRDAEDTLQRLGKYRQLAKIHKVSIILPFITENKNKYKQNDWMNHISISICDVIETH